eukprot:5690726-Prymnesium_polylepis.1
MIVEHMGETLLTVCGTLPSTLTAFSAVSARGYTPTIFVLIPRTHGLPPLHTCSTRSWSLRGGQPLSRRSN